MNPHIRFRRSGERAQIIRDTLKRQRLQKPDKRRKKKR